MFSVRTDIFFVCFEDTLLAGSLQDQAGAGRERGGHLQDVPVPVPEQTQGPVHREGQLQSHRMPARLCGTQGRQKVEINVEILAYNLGEKTFSFRLTKTLFLFIDIHFAQYEQDNGYR